MCQSKTRTQNPTFWPLVTPRHAPGANVFVTTVFYSSLPLIWHATWLFVQNVFLDPLGPHPLSLPPSKFRMCSSSPHPYLLWKFWDSSSNGLGQWCDITDGWTDRGYRNIPAFSLKSAGKIIFGLRCPNSYLFQLKMATLAPDKVWGLCFSYSGQDIRRVSK